MTEDPFFHELSTVKIIAAIVGISKSRWGCINEKDINTKTKNYIDIMKINRFDHLPIIHENGNVYDYFKTNLPNDFTQVERHKITYQDTIDFQTNIEEVIKLFATEKPNRHFYFLSSQSKICGLITLGNLNCKPILVYLYSFFCSTEMQLADYIKKFKKNNEIVDYLKLDKKYNKVVADHSSQIEHDLENHILDYLYFPDLLVLIKEFNLYLKIGYSSEEWEVLCLIKKLRNRIAHPTQNLISPIYSIKQLNQDLDLVKELLFRLNNLK